MNIYCCGCNKKVDARLVSGVETYPHRHDLHDLPFWKCDSCGNFVGCHHKTKNRTSPLGSIPTNEIKKARQLAHRALDPIWKDGKIKRSVVYEQISKKLGYEYHTADIRSIEEYKLVYKIIRIIKI